MQILGNIGSDSGLWTQGSTIGSTKLAPPPTPISFSTSTTTSVLTSQATESSSVSPTLVRLCSLWPYIHSSPAPSPPDICQDLPRKYILNHEYLFNDSNLQYHPELFSRKNIGGTGERMVGIDAVKELAFSGRSFSLMGVLGGVLFILLVIAFITCIRHRKRVRNEADGELDLDIISSRIRRIHQVRASHHLLSVLSSMPETPPAPPPDYDTVLKQREKEEADLPSYLEAIRRGEDRCSSESPALRRNPTVISHGGLNERESTSALSTVSNVISENSDIICARGDPAGAAHCTVADSDMSSSNANTNSNP